MIVACGGTSDPRLLPAYTIPEVSHYLHLPMATIRSWVIGRPYLTRKGKRWANPVISLPAFKPPTLSFINLVEIHVLAAITRVHQVDFQKVRRAVFFLRREFSSDHPLAEKELETDKKDIFIQRAGELINITQDGQVAMRQMLELYLTRIEREARGIPIRLFPFTRTGKIEVTSPKSVVIDPGLAFGRPVLVGTGITTSTIAERCKAGETIGELAEDYGRPYEEIEEAIRCELDVA